MCCAILYRICSAGDTTVRHGIFIIEEYTLIFHKNELYKNVEIEICLKLKISSCYRTETSTITEEIQTSKSKAKKSNELVR